MLILVYIALSSILVYATAVRLRFEQPTVNDIRRKTGTELDEMIVSSLIGAARRLLPIDNTPQGNALRIEQHRIKLADSKRAEDTFCAELDRLGYVFLREAQQEGEAVTPDVRFIKPTNVCGHLCMWLEYKNYFGFRSNPCGTSQQKSIPEVWGSDRPRCCRLQTRLRIWPREHRSSDDFPREGGASRLEDEIFEKVKIGSRIRLDGLRS